jgi:hypothetical protein
MPCIWGIHSGVGQLFCVTAILPHTVAGVHGSVLPVPGGAAVGVTALIDTGATGTCISQRHAQRLNLQPVGKATVHGVSGPANHNTYAFKIGFPFAMLPGTPMPQGMPPPPPGAHATQLHVLERVIVGSEFHGAPHFDILLGMDVISTGSLVVLGNGTFGFSF